MDQSSHQLLARAALPLQHDRRIRLGEALHPAHELSHDGTLPDEPPFLLVLPAGAWHTAPQTGNAEGMPQYGQQTIVLDRQAMIVKAIIQKLLLHPGEREQVRRGKCNPDHGAAGLAKERFHGLGRTFAQQHYPHFGSLLDIMTESLLGR